MSTKDEWRKGYAMQSQADFNMLEFVQKNKEINKLVFECHKLQFLQMACEKLCKAHLIESGTPPSGVKSSHGYVAKPLPRILQHQFEVLGNKLGVWSKIDRHIRHLAEEIELLNPAIQRDGKRPDNCEYPWEDDQKTVHSPLRWAFNLSRLLTLPSGRTFLKLLRMAINDLF